MTAAPQARLRMEVCHEDRIHRAFSACLSEARLRRIQRSAGVFVVGRFWNGATRPDLGQSAQIAGKAPVPRSDGVHPVPSQHTATRTDCRV